jgi:hypothetical protein
MILVVSNFSRRSAWPENLKDVIIRVKFKRYNRKTFIFKEDSIMNENMNNEVMETVVEDFEVADLEDQRNSTIVVGGLIAGIAAIGVGAALWIRARRRKKMEIDYDFDMLDEEELEDDEEYIEVVSGDDEEPKK